MAKIAVGFSVDSERDHDIIAWLEALPKWGKSGAIRKAIRASLGRGADLTLGDLYQGQAEIKRMLKAGVVAVQNGSQEENETRELDPERQKVQDILDGLGV